MVMNKDYLVRGEQWSEGVTKEFHNERDAVVHAKKCSVDNVGKIHTVYKAVREFKADEPIVKELGVAPDGNADNG